jgi:hypothetical protein
MVTASATHSNRWTLKCQTREFATDEDANNDAEQNMVERIASPLHQKNCVRGD